MKIWKEDSKLLEGREKQWLFSVVRNQAFDILKKAKRDVADDSLLAKQADPGLRADEKIEETQKNNQLLERMKRLTKPQEEVIKLKFIDGFGYKEISSITGHSTSYVGVLIHEAIKILKTEEGQI